MLGSQVMNQSAENGSMPFGGETPLISLYRRTSRSRPSPVSASSTRRRAPTRMSEMASCISLASLTTLFLLIRGSVDLLDGLVGHQHGGVSSLHGTAEGTVVEGCQKSGFVKSKSAQQRTGASQLDRLREREVAYD